MIGVSDTAAAGWAATFVTAMLVTWLAFLAIPTAVAFRRRNYPVAAVIFFVNLIFGLGLPVVLQFMLGERLTSETLLLWPGFWWFVTLIWASSLPHEQLVDADESQRAALKMLQQRVERLQRTVDHIEHQVASSGLLDDEAPTGMPPRVAPPPPPARAMPSPPSVPVVPPAPVVRPETRPPAPLDDVTPIMGDDAPAEIKVRCTSCGKKFSGAGAILSRLKACPKCKASPFATEPV